MISLITLTKESPCDGRVTGTALLAAILEDTLWEFDLGLLLKCFQNDLQFLSMILISNLS